MSIQHVAAQAANPADVVHVDVPLLIRLLEFAKEDADTDMQLHKLVENALELQRQGVELLGMDNYAALIPAQVEASAPYNVVLDGAQYYATRSASLKDFLTSLAGYIKSDEPELAKAFLDVIKRLGSKASTQEESYWQGPVEPSFASARLGIKE
jgi:hypothetical protein